MADELTTEEKIIKAAEDVFLKRGFDGARMQEIATEADINKALLHYYFKSKEQLMEKVFIKKFSLFLPKMMAEVAHIHHIDDIIRAVISNYFEMLNANPYLPLFVVDTAYRNPQFLKNIVENKFFFILQMIKNKLAAGEYHNIDPRHLMMNVMSLTVFPFLMQPLFLLIFNMSKHDYDALLEERRKVIFQTVKLWMEANR